MKDLYKTVKRFERMGYPSDRAIKAAKTLHNPARKGEVDGALKAAQEGPRPRRMPPNTFSGGSWSSWRGYGSSIGWTGLKRDRGEDPHPAHTLALRFTRYLGRDGVERLEHVLRLLGYPECLEGGRPFEASPELVGGGVIVQEAEDRAPPAIVELCDWCGKGAKDVGSRRYPVEIGDKDAQVCRSCKRDLDAGR